MQKLEGRTAKFILKNLRHNLRFAWCGRMLSAWNSGRPFTTMRHYRVWQRRYYDFNVWREKKTQEKLDYMHNNPVRAPSGGEAGRLAVVELEVYTMEDSSVLAMGRMP
jgi:hypothetical protein